MEENSQLSDTPAPARKERKDKVAFSWDSYFGFATYARASTGNWRLFINWKRIGILFATCCLAGYFAIAGLRYANDKYRKGLETTKFSTMLLYPFSVNVRQEHRRALGEFYINKARETKIPGEVIGNVRTALGYWPMNPDARIYFSYVMFYQRLVKEGVKFLADGLPAALDHKDYVTYFVHRCLETAEDDVLINAVRENADSEKITTENKMILAVAASQACVLRGRFDEAREFMAKYELENTMTGRVLLAQILWESGEQERAISLLDQVVAASGENIQVVLLRAMYLSSTGDRLKARTSLMRTSLATNSPEIRMRIISLLSSEADKEFRERLIETYIDDYKNNSAALLQLSQYATDQNDFALMERIHKLATEKILIDLPKFEMHYIEALTATDRPDDAIKLLDRLSQENMAWVEQNSATLDCLRTMAYYKSGKETLGKLMLERTLKNRSVTVAQLALVGRRLTEMGRLEEGRDAYQAAYLLENYNHQALVALVDYALAKRDTEVMFRYLPELLDSRRPPRGVLLNVRRFLASDRMLFIPDTEKYLVRVNELLDSKAGTKEVEQGKLSAGIF